MKELKEATGKQKQKVTNDIICLIAELVDAHGECMEMFVRQCLAEYAKEVVRACPEAPSRAMWIAMTSMTRSHYSRPSRSTTSTTHCFTAVTWLRWPARNVSASQSIANTSSTSSCRTGTPSGCTTSNAMMNSISMTV